MDDERTTSPIPPGGRPGSEARRAREVFERVCELSGEARERALAEACGGDEALRARVELLLRAEASAGAFINSPTSPILEDGTAVMEAPGSMIGPYKLLQVIGEGGFGVVYMAEQTEPIKRRVALKVIKLGMDTRQVIARFEAERQALAMMDHPNIARVFDAESTSSGRPYFVMELVRGDPIHLYCDRERLSTASRLELFETVCRAVQHAHHKGVIHRDIKPGNVLVTIADGKPIPKVIDFGIAKATNSELTSKTLFTEFRQLIGTPEYMSPEQAERSGVDIDTRSDIYSLGVLLYELLTGTTPLDSKRLRSAAWGELQRMIREEEPQTPSIRLSTLGDVLPEVAKKHQEDPARFRQSFRGDIDWMVMKCLEKDRTRRYPTADGLAADVRLHLDGHPISAGPPSAGYVLRKFAMRHRRLMVSVGVAAAAIVLGLIGTSTAAVWAMKERKAARASEAVAQEQVARSRRLLSLTASPIFTFVQPDRLRAEWQADIKDVRATTGENDPVRVRQEGLYASWLFNAGLRTEAASELDAVFERALRVLAADDPARMAIVNTQTQRMVISRQSPESLPDLYTELVKCMESVFGADAAPTLELKLERAGVLARVGRVGEGIVALKEYLDLREAGHGQATETSVARVMVAAQLFLSPPVLVPDDVVGRLMRLQYAELRAFAGINNEAFVGAARTYGRWLWDRERYADAEPVYANLLISLRAHPATDPTAILVALHRLGACKLKAGHAAEAEPLLRERLTKSIEYNGEKHPYTHEAQGWLGECLVALNKFDEAEPLLASSREGMVRTSTDAKEKRRAAERLAELYTAWSKPEQAERWRIEAKKDG